MLIGTCSRPKTVLLISGFATKPTAFSYYWIWRLYNSTSVRYLPMTPTTTNPLSSPLPALTQPGSPQASPDRGVDTPRSPGKFSLDRAPKRKVPVWYRRSRTFWAGGAILALLPIGGGLIWKFSASSVAEEITATVKRANLTITVTERGELESSKTIDARCEVEGYH